MLWTSFCVRALTRVSVSQDEETAMLGEIVHLQTIAEDLRTLTVDPHKLPPASEQVSHQLAAS